MPSTNTPNMGLTAPTVGQQPGPQWAQDVNGDLSILDAHDHGPGAGVPVTPAGLSITSDLPFGGNNATLLRSTRFVSQVSPISGGSDLNAVSVSGVDLYYRDGNGNSIRLTQSGSIAGASGSIANLVPPASATYVSGTKTFVWQADSNQAANLDAASVIIRKLTTSSPGITISAPVALASNYTMTLLAAPPASQLALQMDNSGNLNASNTFVSAVTVNGNITSVGGNVAVGAAKALMIDNVSLTKGSIGSDVLTVSGQMQIGGTSGPGLLAPGDTFTLSVQDNTGSNARPLIVSPQPSAHGLYLVRGNVSAAAGVNSGEGWGVTRPFTGVYHITFADPFADDPAVVVTPQGSILYTFVGSLSSTDFTVSFSDSGINPANTDFSFIAIGQRGV